MHMWEEKRYMNKMSMIKREREKVGVSMWEGKKYRKWNEYDKERDTKRNIMIVRKRKNVGLFI